MSETKTQLLELASEKIAKMFSKTDVKLKEAKLVDGTKVVIEDDEIFVLTDEGERLPAPVGEHELDTGEVVVVQEEGKIAETKEKAEEEVDAKKEEKEVDAKKEEKEMDLASEVEKLKKEMAEVKEMMKPKKEVETSKEKETKVEASKQETTNEQLELNQQEQVEKVTHSPEKNVKKQKLTLHSQNRVRGIKDGVYSNLFN